MSDTNADRITAIHQRLNPHPKTPIRADSSLYVTLYNEKNDPVRAMAKRIDRAQLDSVQLLSGCRGSGKTTELHRLRLLLEKDGYIVFVTDIIDFLNPAQPIAIEELLIVLGAALAESASKALDSHPAKENIANRFINYLRNTNIELTELGLDLPGAKLAEWLTGFIPKFKATLRTTDTFRQKINTLLAGRTATIASALQQFAKDITDELTERKGENKGLVFLVDSLERIQNPGALEADVMKSVEHLFSTHNRLLRIENVHLVYTVPPWLRYLAANAAPLELMIPCVKLWDRDPETGERLWHEDGWRIMREVIAKRLHPESLADVFGPPDQEGRHTLLDKIIENCGGHFRDLLRLATDILPIDDTLPTTADDVDAAIANLTRHYPLADNNAEWLKKIADTGEQCRPDDKTDTVARFTRFLDNHSVLYFLNHREWYDVHPVIRPEVERIVRRLEREREQARAAANPVTAQ